MKSHTIGRIISAVLLGFLLGALAHHDQIKRGEMGREAFLAKQAARFDRHFARPDPLAAELFVGVIMVGLSLGAYELVAFGLSRILKKLDDDVSE